jgi:hypothetical protein
MKHGAVVFAIAVWVVACSSAADKPEHPPAHDDAKRPVAGSSEPTTPHGGPRDAGRAGMTPVMAPALEAELSAIRKAPGESVGFGLKAYLPYEPNQGDALIGSSDPEVTPRLLAEALHGGDRVYRLAVLHVLGKRASADVDAALLQALEDPELRATAAYLLGRAGSKGYPTRQRHTEKLRAALRAHLTDPGSFEDPFYQRTFRTQDFVLAAWVRITGVSQFRIASRDVADLIGLGLPDMTDAIRADLLAQVKAHP